MPEREHITEGLDCWCSPMVESYPVDTPDADDEAAEDSLMPRPTPTSRADPRLSNIVDSTGHWMFPALIAPLVAFGAVFGLVVLIGMCVARVYR